MQIALSPPPHHDRPSAAQTYVDLPHRPGDSGRNESRCLPWACQRAARIPRVEVGSWSVPKSFMRVNSGIESGCRGESGEGQMDGRAVSTGAEEAESQGDAARRARAAARRTKGFDLRICGPFGSSHLQERVWEMLSDPASSTYAMIIWFVIMATIVFSTLAFIVETSHEYYSPEASAGHVPPSLSSPFPCVDGLPPRSSLSPLPSPLSHLLPSPPPLVSTACPLAPSSPGRCRCRRPRIPVAQGPFRPS